MTPFQKSVRSLYAACESQAAGAIRVGKFNDVGVKVSGGRSWSESDIRVFRCYGVDSRLGPDGVKEWAQDVALHILEAAEGHVFPCALEEMRAAVPAFEYDGKHIRQLQPYDTRLSHSDLPERWPKSCLDGSDPLALLLCAALGSSQQLFIELTDVRECDPCTRIAIVLFMYRLNQAMGLIPETAHMPKCRDKDTLHFNWDVGCIQVPLIIDELIRKPELYNRTCRLPSPDHP